MANKQFYHQSTPIDNSFKDSSRLDLLIPLLKDKNVLHIGFVDWPITDVNKSLHLTLSKYCKRIDGHDVNFEHAENLRVENGDIFYTWEEIPNNYDVILIPEVLEHVDNVAEFLKKVNTKQGTLIITTPDAFLLQKRSEYVDGNFVEIVHPDHNCYYTPFTLKNTIEKYTDRKVEKLYWVQSQSVVAICK
jgi:hypothetical protein